MQYVDASGLIMPTFTVNLTDKQVTAIEQENIRDTGQLMQDFLQRLVDHWANSRVKHAKSRQQENLYNRYSQATKENRKKIDVLLEGENQ